MRLGNDKMEECEYMQKIAKLEVETIENARKFAAEMVKTVNYADSGQTKKEVVENNILVGRLGEEAARLGFINLGYKVVGPDYKIYNPKEKRWKYDLIIENDKSQKLGINVMTQAASQARYHGVNWILQSIEKGRKDPLQNDPDSLVCLVELDDSFRWYPCIIYRLYKIGDLQISDAKGKYFGIKKVIKKEDLPCFADTKDKTEQGTIDDAWGC